MSSDASECRTKGRARIPILGVVGIAESRGGKYDKHLDVKHPDWKVEAIGSKLYQSALLVLRGSGSYSMGRKINSRGTADGGMWIFDWKWEWVMGGRARQRLVDNTQSRSPVACTRIAF